MTDGQAKAQTFIASLSPGEKRRLTAAVKMLKDWILERNAQSQKATHSPPLLPAKSTKQKMDASRSPQ